MIFGRRWGVVTIAFVIAVCTTLRAQGPGGDASSPGALQGLKAQLAEQQREIDGLTSALREQQELIQEMLQSRDRGANAAEARPSLQTPRLGEVASTTPVIPLAATAAPALYAANGSLAAVSAPAAPAPPPPQVRPAEGYVPPDNSPKIGVGVTLYPNFALQEHPTITDSPDGNIVRKSAFDVSRAYLNITGNISHIVAFRITPDVSRETGTTSSLNGSLEFRIKYAFLQTNFDDWMTKGSWARLGIQQTPYVDFMENIYRYRFQGTTFSERAGFPFSSSDAGASFHYNFKDNYGDLHVGVYNGENYNKTDVNNEKAIEMRFTVRPFAKQAPVLRGFRATLFYDGDNYLQNAERKRLFGNVTFEHKFLVAAFESLNTHDQISATLASVEGRGYSIWATPRTKYGWEGLLRYDHWTPNTSSAFVTGATAPNATTTFDSQKQNRMILGIAYWFPHEGSVSSALLFDYDAQIFRNIASTQPVRAFAVHGLINY
jgi:phosphate-selective porin O/P